MRCIYWIMESNFSWPLCSLFLACTHQQGAIFQLKKVMSIIYKIYCWGELKPNLTKGDIPCSSTKVMLSNHFVYSIYWSTTTYQLLIMYNGFHKVQNWIRLLSSMRLCIWSKHPHDYATTRSQPLSIWDGLTMKRSPYIDWIAQLYNCILAYRLRILGSLA